MTSLRQQLRRALVVALTLLLGAALIAITVVVWDELVDSFDDSLQARAAAVSAWVEEKDGRFRFTFSSEFLRSFDDDKPRNYFEIWDEDDVTLTRSPSLRDEELPLQVGKKANRATYWNITFPNGRPGRAIGYVFTPQPADGSRSRKGAPVAKLVVASDREDLNETLGGLVAAVCGCGILLFAAIWLVVPLVLRRGLAPLDRLAAEVARIEAHSLDARLPVEALPNELRPVGDRLNDLLARLAASFERERRFSADLAHELRTPLAELRSQAECALKWPESRAIPVSIRIPWRSRPDRAVEAKFKLEPGRVQADPALLRSILHNLLENAADYAPANGELRVTGEMLKGGYRIRIANPAGELTADDVGQLFDRFWRKEAARSDGKHAGLGLGVSRAFATAMDWQLDATIDPKGWLVFTLETLPGGPSGPW